MRCRACFGKIDGEFMYAGCGCCPGTAFHLMCMRCTDERMEAVAQKCAYFDARLKESPFANRPAKFGDRSRTWVCGCGDCDGRVVPRVYPGDLEDLAMPGVFVSLALFVLMVYDCVLRLLSPPQKTD
jgi:hypothetical protein